ncbi:MAG TPA: YceI family protein [Ferruginibacter sp.]|jgi:polyisoprenoid-binding protein YceI|nr:YceI family protein [Ferruginibacter sp.]
MKQFKYFLLGIFGFMLCAANTIENKYILATGYTVTISGTSNFHDWDEKVGTVTGDAVINWNGDKSFDLAAINIKMDVHSIKSNEGSAMNNNTYKALKADANPEIIFVLNTPISVTPNSSINTFSAKGKLTIAGVTKPVQMQVKLSMQGKDKLIFEGSQTIKMTDYGVNPPTALFGTLKTGDDIVISFKTSFVTNN